MKNILLRFLFTLTFSTSIQANLFSNEGYLGKFPYNGISILVNDDYIADERTDFSIKKHIEDTVKLNDVSPKNPINIVIGEGIKDNQYDFDVFIDYLKNTDAKNIVIEIDDYLEFKNQITFFKHHFLSSSKIESFLTRRLESLKAWK